MSKEVKRYYTTLAFDRPDIAANCSIQGRPATCTSYELTCVVLASDYDALLAERDAYKKALEKLARVPGCGCSFPCRCGGEEWTRAELEGRMDYAAETLTRTALQGEQP